MERWQPGETMYIGLLILFWRVQSFGARFDWKNILRIKRRAKRVYNRKGVGIIGWSSNPLIPELWRHADRYFLRSCVLHPPPNHFRAVETILNWASCQPHRWYPPPNHSWAMETAPLATYWNRYGILALLANLTAKSRSCLRKPRLKAVNTNLFNKLRQLLTDFCQNLFHVS